MSKSFIVASLLLVSAMSHAQEPLVSCKTSTETLTIKQNADGKSEITDGTNVAKAVVTQMMPGLSALNELLAVGAPGVDAAGIASSTMALAQPPAPPYVIIELKNAAGQVVSKTIGLGDNIAIERCE